MDFLDEFQNAGGAVRGRGVPKGFRQFFPVSPGGTDRFRQGFLRHIFLGQDAAQAAFFHASGIQNLVAAAGSLRLGNQQHGAAQGLEFTQSIGTGAAEHQIRTSQDIRQLRVQEFNLSVSGNTL